MKVEEVKVPIEYKSALAQAKTYADTMHMSPTVVRDQLVSEYGAKFMESEADYAIQHLGK